MVPLVPKKDDKLYEEEGEDLAEIVEENSYTGVRELDNILGGGFPKGAVVLLAGSSGSGKTILSFQWLFAGVHHGEKGIYFTVTEPLFKAVENLEAMSFYDRDALENEQIMIVDLQDILARNVTKTGKDFDQEKVIDFIEKQVKAQNAKRLCIDSVTAIAYQLQDKAQIRQFIFKLGTVLASLGCTTILTSEVTAEGHYSVYGVEEFISDAILRMDQVKVRGELQRVMGLVKVRGRSYRAEELFFRITDGGITAFPLLRTELNYGSSTQRMSTGVPELDEMVTGGLLEGSSTLVAGPTGTGKTLLGMHFIMEGLRHGEASLYVGFEESREQFLRNAKGFGWDMEWYEREGLLTIRCAYPGEKLPEEHLHQIKHIVEKKNIKRCVVDSLSSVSNSYPGDVFNGFAQRLNGYLKGSGATAIFTMATQSLIGQTTLTESTLSTMTDNIIMLRYVEMEGELKLMLNILKVRGSAHSKGLRRYDITEEGMVIGPSFRGYEGMLTGVGRKVSDSLEERLNEEFKQFIGPMAGTVFSDLKSRGLTKEHIEDYLKDLTKQGILKKDDAKRFKERVFAILNGG
ncbi:MAG: circadian clock protein KaiC [Candidatus Undinarchaeales archaeon]|nr:circadian clock protein KaiC [Candidatus Undinarchaeales archaeon]MDP7492869.1 circadian clock protein KaiC [Candidatus Undinarchaeales archaeon]